MRFFQMNSPRDIPLQETDEYKAGHADGYLCALIAIEGERRAAERRAVEAVRDRVYPIFPEQPNLSVVTTNGNDFAA